MARKMKGAQLLELARAAGSAAVTGGRAADAPAERPLPRPPTPAQDRRYGAQALQFRVMHPEIYDLFLSFAREMLAAGDGSVPVMTVWERVRWDLMQRGHPSGLLNNNYRAHFARWALKDEPRLHGRMRVRVQRAP